MRPTIMLLSVVALLFCNGPVQAAGNGGALEAEANAATEEQLPDGQAGTPSPLGNWSSDGERIAQSDAIARFDLESRLISYGSRYFRPSEGAWIRVVEGDLDIDTDLLLDWDEGWGSHGLIVTGNLTVKGSIINANMNGGPFLLVGGQTRAHAIIGGGAELVFEGNTQVADIVVGHYNDGILIFAADLTAPAVVTMDHHLEVRGRLDGRWFDVFDGTDRWSSFLDMDKPGLALMEEDDWHGLNVGLIPLLKAGQRVVRADLPPERSDPEVATE